MRAQRFQGHRPLKILLACEAQASHIGSGETGLDLSMLTHFPAHRDTPPRLHGSNVRPNNQD